MAKTTLKRKSKIAEEILDVELETQEVVALKKAKADLTPANSQTKTEARKTIGEILCSFREKQGKSIEDISKHLNISSRYIKAIESMDTSMLPERVYTLGFVRSYAHLLGIDPQKSVDHFKREIYDDIPNKKLYTPEPILDVSRPSFKLIIVCICVLSALGMLWLGLNGELNLF